MSGTAAATRHSFERFMRRTRVLCTDALQHLLGEGAEPSTVDRVRVAAEDLEALLQQTVSDGRQGVWVVIGKSHLAGLIALFALALRRSLAAHVGNAEREAFWSLRAAIGMHLRPLLAACKGFAVEPDYLSSIAEALVRTQSIRCYALLLASLESQLGPPSSQPCPPHTAARALAVLDEALALLEVLSYHGYARLRDDDIKIYNFAAMNEEVVYTGLIEHWSRALLLLASRCDSAHDAAGGFFQRLLSVLQSPFLDFPAQFGSGGNYSLSYLLTSHLVGLAAALDGGTSYGMPAAGPGAAAAPLADTAGRRLRLASSDTADTRFAQRALMQWTKSLDGMWSHLQQQQQQQQQQQPPGVPRSARTPLRELGPRCIAPLQRRLAEIEQLSDERRDYEEWREHYRKAGTVRFIEEMLAGLAVPPFKVAATLDVSMRLASSATEALADANQQQQQQRSSSSEAAAAGASGVAAAAAATQQQRQQRPRVPPDQAGPFGVHALKCARVAGWDLGWEPEAEQPPRKLEQLQRWWDLTAQFVRAAAQPHPEWDKDGRWSRAGVWELLPLRTTVSGLAAASSRAATAASCPSADVAAALRVGYPQLQELLLRRPAAVKPKSVDEEFVNPLHDTSADSWAQLLAFADPRVMASLLTTVAKQARRAALQLDAAVAATRALYAAAGIAGLNMFDPRNLPPFIARNSQILDSQHSLHRARSYASEVFGCVEVVVLGPDDGRVPFADCLRSDAAAAAAALGSVAARSRPQPGPRSGGGGGSRGGQEQEQDLEGSGGGSGGGGSSGGAAPGEGSSGPGAHGAAGGGAGADDIADGGGGGAYPAQRADGGVDLDSQHAALQRLMAALSQVVVRVLPDVTRLAASMASSWGRHPGSDRTSTTGLTGALSWVPLLAAASVATGDGAAPPDGPDRVGGSAAAVASASAAAEWDRFLWVEAGLPRLLACGLCLLELKADEKVRLDEPLKDAWIGALRALVHLAPQRLGKALVTHGSAAAAAAPAAAGASSGTASEEGGAAGGRGPEKAAGLSFLRLRKILGPDGAVPEPELLAALGRIRAAAITAAAATGVGGAVSFGAGEEEPLPSEMRQWVAAAALLVPPGEVRAVLPTCDYPDCVNLEGDSEAGLRLAGCGRCGGRVRYCSRGCQTAHWRAGHKAQCAGGAVSGVVRDGLAD
ncbi:hypothetical protein PLESTM_001937600 [Pleodorina starrii]|nr:hypothetical protein PLESTM_001937600 [Pleodorina starrii]